MDDESLSSILTNDSPPETPKAEVPEVKDEKPVEAPVEEAKAEPAAPSAAKEPEKAQPEAKTPPLTAQEHAALVALKAKTKELERQLAEAKAGQQEKPDFWVDPEKAVEEKVLQAVAPLKAKLLNASLSRAAERHTDFSEAAEAFEKMLDGNPQLHRDWLESEDPGEFIYQATRNTPEHREKALTDLKAQLADRDQKLAALAAEIDALKKGQEALKELPKSLNNVPSGAPPKVEDTDEEDISKIVRFKTG